MAGKKSAPKETSFEDKLWNTAEILYGKVSPSHSKDITLGLLFLKFISYWYDQRRAELEKLTDDPKSDIYCKTAKEKEYILNLKDQYTSEGIF